jgi:hypothetical protein
LTERELTSAEVRAKADAITAAILAKRPAPGQAPQKAAVAPVPLEPELEFHDWETWWLPEIVQNWVRAQARANCCATVIPLAAAMTAMATALQGRVEVEIKPGWREPLSLFWVLASPTGTMKSRVLDAAKRPLKALEAKLADEAREQQKTNRRTRHMLEGRVKKLRGMFANKGSLTEDQRNELNSLEHNLEQLPNDKAPVWLYSNINPALIPKKMAHNLEAEGVARLSVMADEDTFLRNMMGRHSGHADLEVVLSGYTGGAIEMTRKSVIADDPVDVRLDHAHLTMLVLTQPHVVDWMRTHPILADQGFWGRTIVTTIPRSDLPELDAPSVPEPVQHAWERLIATLHAKTDTTVVRVPEELWEPGGALHELYADVRRAVGSGAGGEGFAVRSVGRVCRFWALRILSQLSNCHGGSGVQRPRDEGIVIKELANSLYYRALRQAQAMQPSTPPLDGAPLRALRWLRQYPGVTVSTEVSARQVMRALRLSKDTVAAALGELVECGYLSEGSTRRNAHGPATITYKVVSLYAPEERAADVRPLRAVPPPEDTPELERELPPPLADYIGDEFEGESP